MRSIRARSGSRGRAAWRRNPRCRPPASEQGEMRAPRSSSPSQTGNEHRLVLVCPSRGESSFALVLAGEDLHLSGERAPAARHPEPERRNGPHGIACCICASRSIARSPLTRRLRCSDGRPPLAASVGYPAVSARFISPRWRRRSATSCARRYLAPRMKARMSVESSASDFSLRYIMWPPK